jgi:hypothetical protein
VLAIYYEMEYERVASISRMSDDELFVYAT